MSAENVQGEQILLDQAPSFRMLQNYNEDTKSAMTERRSDNL